MTERPNVVPISRDDRQMIEGPVDYVELLAMPSARAATPSGLSRFASSCQHRIAIALDALASDRGLFGFVCFAAGCFFTVGAAYIWSFYL